MKISAPTSRGLTLIEMTVTAGLIGVLGLVVYALLNIGVVLGAKNTASNTAHQQARVAMLEMVQDLHSAISLPQLLNVSGTQAGGISFQQWGATPSNGATVTNGGPHKIYAQAAKYAAGQNQIRITLAAGQPAPAVGVRDDLCQRLIVPSHQIESTIIAISGTRSNLLLTLRDNLPVDIFGSDSTAGDIICYITDRCSYNVVQSSAGPPAQYKLQFTNTQGTRDIVTGITNPRPFSIPTTPAGALYYRFVAAVDLSTADPTYSNRGYRSANILLNGQVPLKARLTTYQ